MLQGNSGRGYVSRGLPGASLAWPIRQIRRLPQGSGAGQVLFVAHDFSNRDVLSPHQVLPTLIRQTVENGIIFVRAK